MLRLLAAALLILASGHSPAAEKVTLALNWKAQPELGGFYQALVAGHYADRGLDVTIRLGGPMINNRPLLPIGRIDFLVGTNLLPAFNFTKQEIPTRVVAAYLQRDPQCVLSHADGPYQTWDDLKRSPLLMANTGRHSFFLWMESAHGFQRRLLRPYNHSLAPFLLHKDWSMQGYATAEPKRVLEASGAEPRVFLLADNGWESYSTVIETRQQLINEKPEVVQAFVDASTIGWYEYLYGDPAAANERILSDNRAMTDDQIAYSIAKMREWGLVDSGDAIEKGIGAIDGQRLIRFYQTLVNSGLYKAGDLDPRDSFTDRFVNRGVGLDRRRELLGSAKDAEPIRSN